MASIFIGDYAPIDFGDATGMNALDIRTKKWVKGSRLHFPHVHILEIIDWAAPELEEKLGQVVPSHSVVGSIASYFVKRYGINKVS